MTVTDDRAGILNRGRRIRSVRKPDAHLLVAEHIRLTDVPDPYSPTGTPELNDAERAHLEVCEHAIGQLQGALTTAGKALATVNSARLYRETHSTFEMYVEDRWGMKRSHAYRMIDAWPIAAALSPIGDINEAQVRELVPVAKRHGVETAVVVYSEVHHRMGGTVTARRINRAAKALPRTLDGPEQAREVICQAMESGKLGLDIPTRTARYSGPPEYIAASAVALLEEILAQQRLMYDHLGKGLVSEALLAEPARADYLLREIARYSRRMIHRVERTKPK